MKEERYIKCRIRTPQFKDGVPFKYIEQDGIFDSFKLIFTPTVINKDSHVCNFSSIQDFCKFKIG